MSQTPRLFEKQTTRDQSEDRPAPKYLIQYRDNSGGNWPTLRPWEVIRASDRALMMAYPYAEDAVAGAADLERYFAES